jgi:hypothetical protein
VCVCVCVCVGVCVCVKARLCTLFPGCSVQFVGVSTDYEAALNLVDIVDAYDGRHGVVLCNVARREGSERKSKWPNGPVMGSERKGGQSVRARGQSVRASGPTAR